MDFLNLTGEQIARIVEQIAPLGVAALALARSLVNSKQIREVRETCTYPNCGHVCGDDPQQQVSA